MTDNEGQQIQDLTSQFSSLQSKFQGLQDLENRQLVKRYGELDTQIGAALAATLSLARLLRGDFDPHQPPTALASTVQTMTSQWTDAKDTARQGYDEVCSYFSQIVQLHDAGLGKWTERLNTVKDKLQAKLSSTHDALRTSRATMQQLVEKNEKVTESARILEKKLYEQKHKYDEADKWTWLYPPARLALEALKPIIEAITHDLEGAQTAMMTASRELQQAQSQMQTQEEEITRLGNLATNQASLISKGTALMGHCDQLVKAVEQMEKEVAQHKKDCSAAWKESSQCSNRAQTANYALTKADYATAILKIANVSANDPVAHAVLTEIVTELADHDDKNGSVRQIKTDDNQQGLLDYVKSKLQQQNAVQYTLMAAPSGKAPIHGIPVEGRLKLMRSMVAPLLKPRGQPGSSDMYDVDRVHLLALVSNLFVTSAGVEG
ncbi:hypothetical protein APSETT444_004876 [Aspergillus pseudonomiae]